MRYYVTSTSITDVGLCRTVNQDSIFTYESERLQLYCVADGMGGHSRGEVASAEIVGALQKWVNQLDLERHGKEIEPIAKDLESCLVNVNAEIYRNYNQNDTCGSTIVALLIYSGHYAVLSLGDSRVYRGYGRRFRLITRDDTWQNSPAAAGISQDKLQSNPNYDTLIAAVGIDESAEYQITMGRVGYRDTFLLCSDGVYKYVSEEAIRDCCCRQGENIQRDNDGELAALTDEIVCNGAPDNYSAILVQVHFRYCFRSLIRAHKGN